MDWSNRMSPTISVIMSVYNDSKYLEKSIESILNQTYNDFEFIICNDCSSDDSLSIIEKYAMLDKRIVIINNQDNLGLATSLNKCLDIAKGEFIARMDSDDISLPNRFKEELDFLKTHSEIAVVGCKCNVIDDLGEKRKEFLIHEGEVTLLDAIKKTQIIHPTVMMRKSALLKVSGYTVDEKTQRAEDYDLWCKLLEKGYKIFNIDRILFLYREGISGIKKRKYRYRIQEYQLKKYWMKKKKVPIITYLYAIKPHFVGCIPTVLMNMYKRIN